MIHICFQDKTWCSVQTLEKAHLGRRVKICFICRPECVAKGMMHLIENGNNGSIWVAEGGQPVYEVLIPDRQTLRVE
jgi:hypothetical protein